MNMDDGMDDKRHPAPGRLELLRAGAWPLTLKFTLILLLVALLPMLLVAYGNLRGGLEGVARTERANLALGAQGLARQLDQLIDGDRKLALLLAEDQDVQAYLQAPATERPGLQGPVAYRLALLMRAHPELANLYLMDAEGVFVAATDSALIGARRNFRDYFTRALAGQVYSSNLLMGLNTGEPGVYFSAPVRQAGGRVIGVAVVKLKGTAVEAILRDAGEGLVAFLADGDGVLIDHPDPAWRYRSLAPLAPERIQAIQAVSQFPVDTLRPLGIAGLEQVPRLTGPGAVDYRLPGGEAWVAGVAPMARHDWRVILAEPESRFAAPLRVLFEQSLATLAVTGALVAVLAWLLGRAMTRPMLILTAAAGQLRGGDYEAALSRTDLSAVGARKDELGALAQVFRGMGEEVYRREFSLDQQVQARTRELADKNSLLEATYRRVDEELRLARDMQQAVLPQHFPGDGRWQVHASMAPAREMGGDFYDCFPLGDGRYGVLVADVSGKGVPAAFFMAVSRTVIEDVAAELQQPAATLARANDLLCDRNPMELFVTVFYGVFDPADGSFVYASAGHNPPLLRRADGRVDKLEVARDMALGVLPGMDYSETRLILGEGDLLLMYTDGVNEALSPAGEEFGDARLLAWLAQAGGRAPERLCTALAEALAGFVAGAEPSDDITVLFLRAGAPVGRRQSWRIPSRVEAIEALAADVEQFLGHGPQAGSGAQSQLAFQVNLCIDELLTNTIQHGLGGDSGHQIQVSLEVDGDWLEIRLQDDAPAFDCFVEAPPPDLDLDLEARPVGGLGVQFVKTLMDEYSSRHDGSGNLVILRKRLAGTGPDAAGQDPNQLSDEDAL